jgi:hypothetical protein
MDGQPYKIFGKIFNLTKRGTSKGTQEENNKGQLEDFIGQLRGSLDEIVKKVGKKGKLTEIEHSSAEIELNCKKDSNGSIQCKYNIKTYLYSKDGRRIECYSNSEDLPYKAECTIYSGLSSNSKYGSFELSNSRSSIEGIIDSILKIHKTLYPGVLMNMDEQNMYIGSFASTFPDRSIKVIPEMKKDSNSFSYDDGRFAFTIYWQYVNPYKP